MRSTDSLVKMENGQLESSGCKLQTEMEQAKSQKRLLLGRETLVVI